ncbi:MAG: PEP/pyruvate-binding domain-containing protein [Dehalococcoidia bacterium]
MDEERRVVWFEDVGKDNISLVGGKEANLGEMTKAHIPMPPGFIVPAQSYFYFLEKSDLSGEISSLLSSLDPNDSGALQRVGSKIKEAINSARMPDLKFWMMVEVPSNISPPSLWRRS